MGRYCERIKADPTLYVEYKKKEKNRKKGVQCYLTDEQKERKRELGRSRQRKYQAKKDE